MVERLRILMVSEDVPYPNMGGLAKHALTLARALNRAGHHVAFLGGNQQPIEVAGAEGEFGGPFFGEIEGHLRGWKERRLGVFFPGKRSWQAKRLATAILRHARDYQVVHYHGHLPNVAAHIPPEINFVQTRHDQGSDCLTNVRFKAGAICTSIDPRSCASCATQDPNRLQQFVTATTVRAYRDEVARSFRRHKTVFVSHMLLKNFERGAGPGPWGCVMHNFVDHQGIEDEIESSSIISDLGDRPQILIAGKISIAKGTESFLRALFARNRTSLRVAIAGDGPDLDRLAKQFQDEPAHFLGWQCRRRVLQLMRVANVIAVPSLWEEPCGTVILEGLYLGKPVFALARGGTPELTRYERYRGQLHLHQSMDALVDDLLHTPSTRTETSLRAVSGELDAFLDKLIKIYVAPSGSSWRTALHAFNS